MGNIPEEYKIHCPIYEYTKCDRRYQFCDQHNPDCIPCTAICHPEKEQEDSHHCNLLCPDFYKYVVVTTGPSYTVAGGALGTDLSDWGSSTSIKVGVGVLCGVVGLVIILSLVVMLLRYRCLKTTGHLEGVSSFCSYLHTGCKNSWKKCVCGSTHTPKQPAATNQPGVDSETCVGLATQSKELAKYTLSLESNGNSSAFNTAETVLTDMSLAGGQDSDATFVKQVPAASPRGLGRPVPPPTTTGGTHGPMRSGQMGAEGGPAHQQHTLPTGKGLDNPGLGTISQPFAESANVRTTRTHAPEAAGRDESSPRQQAGGPATRRKQLVPSSSQDVHAQETGGHDPNATTPKQPAPRSSQPQGRHHAAPSNHSTTAGERCELGGARANSGEVPAAHSGGAAFQPRGMADAPHGLRTINLEDREVDTYEIVPSTIQAPEENQPDDSTAASTGLIAQDPTPAGSNPFPWSSRAHSASGALHSDSSTRPLLQSYNNNTQV